MLCAWVIVTTCHRHLGSFLPSLWPSSNQSLLGSRSRHCYAIKWITVASVVSKHGVAYESRLSLAALITLAESAVMPPFVLGVNCTEPPTAGLAVICSLGVTWFIHGRYRLTRGHHASGFCLILLLQHSPSMQDDSTRLLGVRLAKMASPRASTNLTGKPGIRVRQDGKSRILGS